MPQISVIVPIYNVEAYLNRCIDSILNQTFTDFECILVDDGSTDRCPQICDEYDKKDKRIRVIHKPNGGLFDARNAGMEIAMGEYLYFLDSDDYVEPCLLEILIKEVINSKADVVAFGYRREHVYPNKSYDVKFMPFEYHIGSEKDYLDFICKILLPYKVSWEVCFKLFKTSIIKNNGLKFYDNSIIYAEDLHFFLCYLLNISSIKVIEDVLYHYTVRENSITKSTIVPKINEFVKLNVEFYKYIKLKKYRFLLNKYYMLFYIIMNNRYEQSENDDVLVDMMNVENKHFLRKNIVKFIINAKKMSVYFGVNKNIIIYENINYLIYSGQGLIFKILRSIFRSMFLLKKKVDIIQNKQENIR